MAAFFPKRLSELTHDSDSESTPDKSLANRLTKSCMPKRIAELCPLEESSDEESNNDNLNNAILNDSFIVNPDEHQSVSQQKHVTESKENDKNVLNESQLLLSKLESLNINAKEESKLKEPEAAIHPENNSSKDYRPLKSRQQLFPKSKNVLQEKFPPKSPEKVLSIFSNIKKTPAEPPKAADKLQVEIVPSIFSKIRESAKHTRTGSDDADSGVDTAASQRRLSPRLSRQVAIVAETPLKNDDTKGAFVTPQIKSFRVPSVQSHGYHLANQLSKKKNIQKEFSSQKILFTTPVGVPRPPVATNDSLSLSIDTPDQHLELKLSPIKEREFSKAKKSSDMLFPEIADASMECPDKLKDYLTIKNLKYLLEDKLGCGGSSTVFLATDLANKRKCAIKLVNLEADPVVVEGYLNETRLLAKLQGNPAVVALFDYLHIPEKNILYMVLEKGDSDLHKILQTYRTDIPLYNLMSYWYQILQSVDYIHKNGVIHSDLKPANFLMVGGRLKLIDFGIASNIAVDSTSIIKCSQAGTFNYISPEALIDTSSPGKGCNEPKVKISTKSDVWSLGCILYLFLYKKTPFSHIKNLHNKVNALTNPNTVIEYPKLPNYYPPLLLEMARKCLTYNAKQRPSVAELLMYPFDMVIPLDK